MLLPFTYWAIDESAQLTNQHASKFNIAQFKARRNGRNGGIDKSREPVHVSGVVIINV